MALLLQNEHDALRRLYTHVKKRLSDEFGVELNAEWEARVVCGERDVPLPSVDTEYRKMERALNNVRMLTTRMVNRTNRGGINAALLVEELGHILRFCGEGGFPGSVLRETNNAGVQLANAADPTRHKYMETADLLADACSLCGRLEGEHSAK